MRRHAGIILGMTTTTDQPITSTSDAFTRAAADQAEQTEQAERGPIYNDGRVRITLGSAAVLTLLGSAATAMWVRRRARRKMALILLARAASGAGAALPAPHQALPIGGAGGSLLLLALAAARLRRAQAPKRSRDLPDVRDLLLGVALGMGLVGMARGRG